MNAPKETFCGPLPVRALTWPSDHVATSRGGGVPTLVFIHGLGDWADIWRAVIAAWPQSHKHPRPTMVALDLPGHGGSGSLQPEEYRLNEMGFHLDKALFALDIRKAVLIGHSIGAMIALELAARGPKICQAAILIDMGISSVDGAKEAILRHIEAMGRGARNLEDLIEIITARLPFGNPDAVRIAVTSIMGNPGTALRIRVDPEVIQLIAHPLPSGTIGSLLASCPVPVGLIRGKYSGLLSEEALIKMSRQVGRPISVDTISMSGHAIPLEQPGALAKTLAHQLAVVAVQ